MPAALVTGGSSGIGLAIARMLVEEGHEVTVAGRTPAHVEAAAAELGAEGVVADVASVEDCVRLVAAHRDRFGRLDVLVNSAGTGRFGLPDAIDAKQIDLQLAVNLRGLMLVTREAIPLLREASGLVVNLASIAAHVGVAPLAVYGATKAAVVGYTRSLDAALGGDGVRATALSPGFVDTPMSEHAPIPREEMLRPEDCAEAVRMLLRLSPRARVPEIVLGRPGV